MNANLIQLRKEKETYKPTEYNYLLNHKKKIILESSLHEELVKISNYIIYILRKAPTEVQITILRSQRFAGKSSILF